MNERLNSGQVDWEEEYDHALRAVKQLEAERDRLAAALRDREATIEKLLSYANHRHSCVNPPSPCSCGFAELTIEAALASPDKDQT